MHVITQFAMLRIGNKMQFSQFTACKHDLDLLVTLSVIEFCNVGGHVHSDTKGIKNTGNKASEAAVVVALLAAGEGVRPVLAWECQNWGRIRLPLTFLPNRMNDNTYLHEITATLLAAVIAKSNKAVWLDGNAKDGLTPESIAKAYSTILQAGYKELSSEYKPEDNSDQQSHLRQAHDAARQDRANRQPSPKYKF